jgi:hypothetical protein
MRVTLRLPWVIGWKYSPPAHPQASPSPPSGRGFFLGLDSTSLKLILRSQGVIYDGKAVFAG